MKKIIKYFSLCVALAISGIMFCACDNNKTIEIQTNNVFLSQTSYSYTGEECKPNVTVNLFDNDLDPSLYTVVFSNNINAGQASVTVIMKEEAQTVSGQATVFFTINKVTPTPAFPTDLTAVYGQTLEDISLTDTHFQWQNPELSVGNVGTQQFNLTYIPDDTTNYNTVTQKVSVTVTPKIVTEPTAVIKDYVYSGEPQKFEVSGFDEPSTNISGDTQTNAGQYSVIFTLKDTQNFKWANTTESELTLPFVISPKTIEIPTLNTTQQYKYNGQVKSFVFDNLDENFVTVTNNERKDVGTQQIVFTLKDIENCVWSDGTTSEKQLEASIVPEVVSLVWFAPENLVFNGSAKIPTVYISNLHGTDQCEIVIALTNENDNVNAGTFTFIAQSLTNDNYVLPSSDLAKTSPEYTIQRQVIDKPTAGTNTFDFTGEEITYTPQGFDSSTMEISNNIKTQSGKYTAQITPKDNYKWSDGTNAIELSWIIGKQTIAIPTIASKAFTGQLQTANIQQTDAYYVIENNGGTNVGNYDVKLMLTDTDFYSFEGTTEKTITLTFEITQATNEWTTTPSIESWAYGEIAKEPIGSAQFGTVKFEYKLIAEQDSAYSETTPTNAGNYVLRASVEGNTNFTALSKTINFSISQATNVWTTTPSIEGWVFGEIANTLVSQAKFGNDNKTIRYYDSNDVELDLHPTNAGPYKVKVEVAETNNYTGLSETVNFSIAQATNSWTTTPSIEDWSYGEQAKEPTGSVKVGTVVFEYKLANSPDTTYKTNAPTNAGNYIMRASVTDLNNYAPLSTTVDFTISQIVVSLTWTAPENLVYDGNEKTPTVEIGGIINPDLCTAETELYTGSNINAGSFMFIATELSNPNYALPAKAISGIYTIAKQVVEAPTIASKAYTSQALTADITNTNLYTVQTNNGGFDAGNYDVVLQLADSNNYKWATTDTAQITLIFTITQAENEWQKTPDILNKIYEKAPSTTYGFSKFGSVKFEYKLQGANDSTYTKTAPINVGNYVMKASVIETANYKGLSTTVEFSITPKEVSLSWNQIANLVYDNTAKLPTATVSGLIDGDQCEATVELNSGDNVNVGSFKAKVTALSNNNYKLPDNPDNPDNVISGTYTITAKDIAGATVTLGDSLVFTGSQQTQTVATVSIDNLAVTYTVSNNTATDVGTHTLTITANGNFTGTVTKEFTIAQETNEWTTAPSIDGWTFGSTANTPTAQAKFGSVKFEYKLASEQDSAYSETVPTNAGNYVLRASVEGNTNYTALSTTVNFTIEQKDITGATITLGTALTYNGSEQEQTISSVKIDNFEVTYETTNNKETNVGDYELTITANGNFTGTATADWSISPLNIATATITLDELNLIYNGNEQTQTISSVKIGELDVTYDNLTGNTATNVGTHTLTITGTGNFTGTATADWSISALDIATAEITLGNSLVFTGELQEQTISSVKINELDVTYTISDNKQTNAGTYTLTITGTGNFTGTATQQFTIAKQEVTAPTIASKVYTGQTLTADIAPNSLYAITENNGGIDAGTYNVKLTLNGVNYAWATTDNATIEGAVITLTFTITQAQNSWINQPSIEDKDYDGTVAPLTYEATFGEATVKYFQGQLQLLEEPVNAGTYGVLIEVAETNNYTALSQELTFTISPIVVSLTWTAPESLIYDGNEKLPTVAVSGTINQDVCTAVTELYDGNNVNAGSFMFKVSSLSNSNYALPENIMSGIYTILKADATYTAPTANTNLTYSGEEQALITAGSSEHGTFTYSLNDNYTTSIPTGKNAGNYTVYWKLTSDANHNDASGHISVTIAKAQVDLPTANTNLVYNSQVQTGVSLPDNALFSLTGNTATNAGNHKATATLTDKDNYEWATIASSSNQEIAWSIAKAQITVTITNKTSVYGANIVTLTSEVTTGTVYSGDNLNIVLTKAEGTNVGTYAITGTYNNSNYEVTFVNGTYTITKANNAITDFSIENWTYGEQAKTPQGTTTFGVPTFTYAIQGSDNYSNTAPTLAGNYTVKAFVAGTDNYNEFTATFDFTIYQKEVELLWSTDNFEYDGTEKTPTVTATGLIGDDTCEVTASLKEGSNNTNAGTFIFTATELNNSNYKLPQTAEKSFTISPKNISEAIITLDELNLVYDGTEKTQTISSVTLGSLTLSTTDYTVSNSTATTAGTHTLTITGTGNFTGTATQEWIIAKASNSWTAEASITGWTYGETANTPTATAEQGTVVFEYKLASEQDSAYSETIPTNAGNYVLRATASSENYETITSTCNFTITQKEATLVWTAPTNLVYDKTTKIPTVSVSNLEDGDSTNVSISLTQGTDNIDVGSFTFTATAISNENYKLPQNPISDSFTITPKGVDVGGRISANNKVYDGTKIATFNYDNITISNIQTGDEVSLSATGTFDKVNAHNNAFVTISSMTLSGKDAANYTILRNTVNDGLNIVTAKITVATQTVSSADDFTQALINVNNGNYDEKITLDSDITLTTIINKNFTQSSPLSSDFNLNLNGHTLTVKSLTLTTNTEDATITISNGTIITTDGVSITAPNGNVIINDVTAYDSNGEITLNATTQSLHFKGNVAFNKGTTENSVPAEVSIPADTRVVIETGAILQVEKIKVEEVVGHTLAIVINSQESDIITIEGVVNISGTNMECVIDSATVIKPTANNTVFTYTGKEQTYTLETSEHYTITGDKQTNAGTHTVTVSLNDKTNTKWIGNTTDDLTFEFVINKAPLTVTASDKSVVWGTTPSGAYTATGFVNGETNNVLTGTEIYDFGEYDQSDLQNNTTGTYDITISGLSADNYDITFEKGTLTVTKAVCVQIKNDNSKSYFSSFPTSLTTSGTYQLFEDVSISRFTIGSITAKNLTVIIDLNSHSLTCTCSDKTYSAMLVHNSSTGNTVTVKNGTLNALNSPYSAIRFEKNNIVNLESTLTINTNADAVAMFGNDAILNTSATIVTTANYGIVGNGSQTTNSTINVTGGSITAGHTGIYHPQDGTLNISGGTITAPTPIEIRAGTLNITCGTFVSNATTFSCTANESGTTTIGAALAISQHTTNQEINVTISNASFEGISAVYVTDTTDKTKHNDNINVTINSGTFRATDGFSGKTIWVENGTLTIKGGTFTAGHDEDKLGNSTIYAENYGRIIVEGGDFSSDAQYNGRYWVLNIRNADKEKASLIVKGGTFHGFNPAGPNTDDLSNYLANETYQSVENNGVWTVSKING